MNRLTVPVVVLLLGLVTGCGDNIQFADPPGQGTVGQGADPFADPGADDAAARQDAAVGDQEPLYEGTVKLAPGYALPATYTVYVIAYQPGTKIPALVQSYSKPSFPFPFTLTIKNAQLGEPEKGASLQLGVILSESGSVTPGGGVFSKTLEKEPRKPGQKNIVLTAEP